MSQYPYSPPDFLQNQGVDDIHRRMMDNLPDDIDKSELQIPWDFTRPAAIEKAEFVEFELNQTIQLMFVLWSYGEWLDLHAEKEGLARRAANRASGVLLVTGAAGTAIARGFQFATLANLAPSVIFEATEDVSLNGIPNAQGHVTAEVPVRAIEGGITGNVPPDTIIQMPRPDSGVSAVTNPVAMTGGTPEERDDDLRERVIASIRRGISFTGNDADYVRWAREVPGVGSVLVDPEWDDPNLPENFMWLDAAGNRRKAGAVRIFIIDANGLPANQQILDAVYDHIVSPGNRLERLAPIGATLTVAAPAPLYITVAAQVTLDIGEHLDAVKARFSANLDNDQAVRASTDKSGAG